jgi:hypothetical protein
MAQVFLTKTTTVTVQTCSGSKLVNVPVAKIFVVSSAPVLQIFMSYSPTSFAPKLLSLTATAMAVDARRLNASFTQVSARDTIGNVQLDVVTSSILDAQTLRNFVDNKLRNRLSNAGLNILNISTNILLPTPPPTSDPAAINTAFALGVGLGVGVPMLLLACFGCYLHGKYATNKTAAAKKLQASPHDFETSAPVNMKACLTFRVQGQPPLNPNPNSMTTSASVLCNDSSHIPQDNGIYLTAAPRPLNFTHESGHHSMLGDTDQSTLVGTSPQPAYSGMAPVQQEQVVHLQQHHVQSPTLTPVGTAPALLQSTQLAPPPRLMERPQVDRITPYTPIQAWDFAGLPGSVVDELSHVQDVSEPSQDGFWT